MVFCGTLSKALGGFGGIVPGSGEFVAQCRSASHYYDGASAPPSPVAAASARALELVVQRPEIRHRLHENVRTVRQGLRQMGISVEDTPSPIVGFTVGTAQNMRRIHEDLKTHGILVPYVARYTGIGAEGVMRLAVSAAHSPQMIERLLDQLRRLL